MAHFEDDSHQRVSGETLPIRVGHTRTLYLWGGNFDGSALAVVASDPLIQIHEEIRPGGFGPNYRKFTIRATADAETIQVSAGPNADGSSPWDTVTFIVLTAAESGEYYRNRVMMYARTHLGAHYLWGAAGAAPDVANGMPGRPGSVHMWTRAIDPDDIMTSAAICRVSGNNTCAGKPWPPGGPRTPAYIPNSAGMVAGAETPQLSYRTVHTDYRPTRKPGIILGERCEGKRHFDCVGFINYCLSLALGAGVQLDICGDAAHGYRGYANAMISVRATDPHRPGDILIFGGTESDFEGRTILSGAHHIAFSAGDGANMVHASETEYGVVQTAIGADLTRRVRHPQLT
jgi:cell wall-associated NlpC family hydrolase